MDESDAELVAALRRGNGEAGGRLAERYLRGCRAVALAITGETATAEDVCQDAFVYAIERIDDCRQPDRFGAWLFQIVRNRARNQLRGRKFTVPLDNLSLENREESPSAGVEQSEIRERLLAALAVIPADRREVVLLHDLEGWTHREIAERLEI